MKLNGNTFTTTAGRLVAAAALVTTLAFTPGTTFAADMTRHTDRAEMRIKDMHAKLAITPAQEELWGKVAQVMRDNATTVDTLTQARVDHAKDMNAVDDLKSYGEITDAHANGIKKLTTEFTALYAAMSDEQKKDADALFKNGPAKHGHAKHHHIASTSK